MKRAHLLICVVTSLLFASGSARGQEEWVVSSAHAQCLFEHLEVYSSSAQNVLMIVLSACPETDTSKALASLTQNSAVPGIALAAADGTGVDDVIVYTHEELTCLAKLAVDLSGPTSRLPKKPSC